MNGKQTKKSMKRTPQTTRDAATLLILLLLLLTVRISPDPEAEATGPEGGVALAALHGPLGAGPAADPTPVRETDQAGELALLPTEMPEIRVVLDGPVEAIGAELSGGDLFAVPRHGCTTRVAHLLTRDAQRLVVVEIDRPTPNCQSQRSSGDGTPRRLREC